LWECSCSVGAEKERDQLDSIEELDSSIIVDISTISACDLDAAIPEAGRSDQSRNIGDGDKSIQVHVTANKVICFNLR